MKDVSHVKEQVQKLLVLSKDKAATENEAIQAAAMAQKLMAKYGIREEDISAENPPEMVTSLCRHRYNAKYRMPLASIIAEAFRCRHCILGGVIAFFGLKLDSELAQETFNYVYEFMMSRIVTLECKQYALTGTNKGVKNSYASGFLASLRQTLRKQSTELMVITPALVVSEYEKMTTGWKRVSSKLSTTVFNGSAYQKGVEDGRHVMGARQLESVK